MPETILILCMCGNLEEARLIARTVVEERLAACVNMFCSVQSVYRWEGQVQEAEEVLLFVKTTADRYAPVERRITELHSYDTPEIIALPITLGSQKYLAWLETAGQ